MAMQTFWMGSLNQLSLHEQVEAETVSALHVCWLTVMCQWCGGGPGRTCVLLGEDGPYSSHTHPQRISPRFGKRMLEFSLTEELWEQHMDQYRRSRSSGQLSAVCPPPRAGRHSSDTSVHGVDKEDRWSGSEETEPLRLDTLCYVTIIMIGE